MADAVLCAEPAGVPPRRRRRMHRPMHRHKVKKPLPKPTELRRRLPASSDLLEWHGHLGDATWAVPKVAAASTEEARPGYDSCSASEYLDTKAVLSAKVDVLVSMLLSARACVVYTGAGISTAAGIGDYASKAKGTRAGRVRTGMNRKHAEPTLSHRVLTALQASRTPHVHQWVNQNHDGLAQKAGFPMSKLNEIHGSWFDSRNRVLMMDDKLRPDLLERLVEWEEKADLCLAMGTSLCGMTADCVATTVGERAAASSVGDALGPYREPAPAAGTQGGGDAATTTPAGAGPGAGAGGGDASAAEGDSYPLGLVIVNLQRTKQDDKAALRIFATTDTVTGMVAKRLRLRLRKDTLPQSCWVK